MFHDFPYTNFNELNLDYLLKRLNEVETYNTACAKTFETDSEGNITVKDAVGNVITVLEFIKKAEADSNGLGIRNYLLGANENSTGSGITFTNGLGESHDIKYPVYDFAVYALDDSPMPVDMSVNDSSEFRLDPYGGIKSIQDLTNALIKGKPVRLVIEDDEYTVKYSVPMYLSNNDIFCDMMCIKNNTPTWKSFGISLTSSGEPEVISLMLTRVQ